MIIYIMKSMSSNGDNSYSLSTIENFKKKIDCDVNVVAQKYSDLIIEYFKFIFENINIKNSSFSKFIIIRGLDTITHVFIYILYYTKNIDLTYFHCQKSFYFYVEFVGQISEDEKTFLQLTSRDATTYVYKKTIFEINNELKKNIESQANFPETDDKIQMINLYINIYKTMLYKIINSENLIKNLIYIDILNDVFGKLNKIKLKKENVIVINDIFDKFYFIINDNEKYFETIQKIIKKTKNLEFLNKYEKNIYNDEDLFVH
jgi:hypothetical protein